MNPQNALQQIVEIDYTNWRGERRKRTIIPVRMEFSENEWHKGNQWLLVAYDDEKGGLPRTFAMSGIHSWKIANPVHTEN